MLSSNCVYAEDATQLLGSEAVHASQAAAKVSSRRVNVLSTVCRKQYRLSTAPVNAEPYSAAFFTSAGSRSRRSSASANDITSAYFSDMSNRLTACDTWLRS